MHDIDEILARILRAQIPALALAAPGTRLSALPDGLELRAELGMDSMDLAELAIAVETAFRVGLTSDEFAACITLGHLSRLVQNKTVAEAEELSFSASFKLADS